MKKKRDNSSSQGFLLIAAILIVSIVRRSEVLLIDNIEDESLNKIAKLHPSIIERVCLFLSEAMKQGFNLRVTSGLRTYAEQDALYNQGRTVPGSIVTNAKAGYSYHNFGLAFDVAFIENDGSISWNGDWNKIGEIGKSFGFEWGGDFKSIIDKPHFQDMFGYTTAQLREKINSLQTINGYVIV